MARIRLCCSLMVLAATATHAATGVFLPGAAPVARPAADPPVKLARPGFALLLPVYVVNPVTALTTLFAVHNPTAAAIVVHASYRPDDGSAFTEEDHELAAHATWTRNLRDVASGALILGSVVLSAKDATTAVPVRVGGDYFIVDPGENFASGNELLDWSDDGCEQWDSRVLNGGLFDGGTRFHFYTPANPPGPATHVVAVGDVYNEAGDFVGAALISSGTTATVISASDIAGLPAFGAIEWLLTQGKGALMTTFSASGRYSVGVSTVCRDVIAAPTSLHRE